MPCHMGHGREDISSIGQVETHWGPGKYSRGYDTSKMLAHEPVQRFTRHGKQGLHCDLLGPYKGSLGADGLNCMGVLSNRTEDLS